MAIIERYLTKWWTAFPHSTAILFDEKLLCLQLLTLHLEPTLLLFKLVQNRLNVRISRLTMILGGSMMLGVFVDSSYLGSYLELELHHLQLQSKIRASTRNFQVCAICVHAHRTQ